MSMVRAMAEFRRDAANLHCRVIRWRITEDQAWELARELEDLRFIPGDPSTIVESMKAGTAHMFGAMVTVR